MQIVILRLPGPRKREKQKKESGNISVLHRSCRLMPHQRSPLSVNIGAMNAPVHTVGYFYLAGQAGEAMRAGKQSKL